MANIWTDAVKEWNSFAKEWQEAIDRYSDNGTYTFALDGGKEAFKPLNLEFDNPGGKREDIKVSFQGNFLNVNFVDRFGNNRVYKYLAPATYYNRNDIKCVYWNGLLTVKLPLNDKPALPNDEVPVEVK